MNSSEKTGKFEKSHKNEEFLLFLCFLSTALIGYFLTNHVALFGV